MRVQGAPPPPSSGLRATGFIWGSRLRVRAFSLIFGSIWEFPKIIVEARKLEHQYPHALKLEHRGS